MVGTIENIIWKVGGSIVVIGWVIAGILYLTSAGGERMKTAKTALIAAVIGTVLVAIAATGSDIIIESLGEGSLEECSN